MFRLSGHITAVKTLSFCPSGLALVSGGIGGLLNIWSLQVRAVEGRTTLLIMHCFLIVKIIKKDNINSLSIQHPLSIISALCSNLIPVPASYRMVPSYRQW